jgi:hypothetical protein
MLVSPALHYQIMNKPAQPHQQQSIIVGDSITSGTLRDRELH